MIDPPTPPTPPSSRGTTRRLTRATDDAKLGGVCSGLARYFGVDPTLVRILAVIATFAGPGVIAYLAAWVIVPADDGTDGISDIRERVSCWHDQTPMWLAVAAVLIGLFWIDDHLGFGDALLPAALIGGGAYLLLRDGGPGAAGWSFGGPPRGPHSGPSDPTDPIVAGTGATTPTDAHEYASGAESAVDAPTGDEPEDDEAADETADEPERDPLLVEADRLRGLDLDSLELDLESLEIDTSPPAYESPTPTPSVRRRRSRLGRWVTGVVVMGMGVAGLLAAVTDFSPEAEVVLAWALLVCGLALLASAWWGRARGLIIVGALLTATLALASAFDVPLRGGVGERSYAPLTAAEAETTEHRLIAGELELDLRGLDLAELADRPGSRVTIDASVAMGELRVQVDPSAFGTDVLLVVEAHVAAGEIRRIDQDGEATSEGGLDVGVDLDSGSRSERTPDQTVVELDLEVGFGQIVIDQTERSLR